MVKRKSKYSNIFVYSQSIGKSDSFGQMQNEDYILYDKKKRLICLADGAGGMGIFSAEWAKHVCDNLPARPFDSVMMMNAWLESIWEPFFERMNPEAEKRNLAAKFFSEGSLCTLAVAWQLDENAWQTCVYGDSVLLVFNRKTKRITYSSMESILGFCNDPYLLSWQRPADANGFISANLTINPDDILLLASDAMAQYILFSYAMVYQPIIFTELRRQSNRLSGLAKIIYQEKADNLSFYNDVLKPLLYAVRINHTFISTTKELMKAKLLASDDFSLIAILPL
jgi:serine/threonine protein phosphatase PrpC